MDSDPLQSHLEVHYSQPLAAYGEKDRTKGSEEERITTVQKKALSSVDNEYNKPPPPIIKNPIIINFNNIPNIDHESEHPILEKKTSNLNLNNTLNLRQALGPEDFKKLSEKLSEIARIPPHLKIPNMSSRSSTFSGSSSTSSDSSRTSSARTIETERSSSEEVEELPQAIKNSQKELLSDARIQFLKESVKASETFKTELKNIKELVPIGKGATGAAFAKNRSGKIVAVVKTMIPVEGPARILEKFVKKLAQKTRPSELLAGKALGKMHAEELSFVLAKAIGFNDENYNIVPETHVVYLNESLQSMQLFISGSKEIETESNTYNEKLLARGGIPTPREKELFQRFAVFDYLMGNLDRHDENWLVKLDPQTGELLNIVAIDNGNSAPMEHPVGGYSTLAIEANQFGWGKFPLAQEELTENVINLINNISKDDITIVMNALGEKLINQQKNMPDRDLDKGSINAFYTNQDVKNRFAERLNVLKYLAAQKNPTLNQLSKYKTKDQIDRLNEFYIKNRIKTS